MEKKYYVRPVIVTNSAETLTMIALSLVRGEGDNPGVADSKRRGEDDSYDTNDGYFDPFAGN